MYHIPRNTQANYQTFLPFRACALDRLPLHLPQSEKLFCILEVGHIKVELHTENYINHLLYLRKTQSDFYIRAIADLLIWEVENGSSHYPLQDYQNLAVQKLYKPPKRRFKEFFAKSKEAVSEDDLRRWVKNIRHEVLAAAFRKNKVNCYIYNMDTNAYLNHVSYYRHYTIVGKDLDTTVVAEGQKLFYILRTTF